MVVVLGHEPVAGVTKKGVCIYGIRSERLVR